MSSSSHGFLESIFLILTLLCGKKRLYPSRNSFLNLIASYPSLAGVLPDGGLDVGAGPRPLDGGRGLPLEGALQPERAVPEDPDVAGEILGELGHLGCLTEVHAPLGHHLGHNRVPALCSHPVEESCLSRGDPYA